jgi:tetraacyldisaccharide 4'-kinase
LNIQAFWSRKGPLNILLLPLSLLFGVVAILRRCSYRFGLLRSGHPGVPVVVVGNLSAGGSGKTPFVIWLVQWLQSQGRKPGVVSRGYGREDAGLRELDAGCTAAEAGDEPLLIHIKTGVPVVVGADRLAAAQLLRERHPEVDIIVSDDGLQHYRLRRDLELVLADGATPFGNGWLLPAGPLREPRIRLMGANALILTLRNEGTSNVSAPVPVFNVRHVPAGFRRLADNLRVPELPDMGGREIQAVTGIARPESFFAQLARLGVPHRPRAFPDHHRFAETDIDGDAAVVMTEKDAVKCQSFAGPDWWALELELAPDPALVDWLKAKLNQPASNQPGLN